VSNKPKVLMVVTLDTKEVESKFIRQCLEESGLEVVLLDAGVRPTMGSSAEITPDQVAAAAGTTMPEIRALNHEGKILEIMIAGATQCALELHQRSRGIFGD
jgi:uncharacterized protein (UPF0261 family)